MRLLDLALSYACMLASELRTPESFQQEMPLQEVGVEPWLHVPAGSGAELCLLRADLLRLPADSSLRHSLRLLSTALSMGKASLNTAHQLRKSGTATRSKNPTCRSTIQSDGGCCLQMEPLQQVAMKGSHHPAAQAMLGLYSRQSIHCISRQRARARCALLD